jgi:hypothetical protein
VSQPWFQDWAKYRYYRYGALQKSKGNGATRDSLNSPKNLAVKLSKPVLCMITVSEMPWVLYMIDGPPDSPYGTEQSSNTTTAK